MKHTLRFVLLWLLPLCLLAACGKNEPPADEILRPVRYLVVTEQSGERVRSFSGVSVAASETKLSFRVSGSLRILKVKVGGQVKSGDLIAALDDQDLQLKYEEAKAAVFNAKVQKSTAEANLIRVRELYENDNVSLSEYEQAKNNFAAASAEYSARLKQLDLQKRQLGYSRLKAPMSGVVTSVPVELNENVNSGDTVAVLSTNKEVEVEVGIPEAYISEIETGMEVEVQFTALPGQTLAGVVTEVSYTAAEYSTYPVTIRLLEAHARLRPGMAAEARFVFAQTAEALLTVPSSAVAHDPEGTYVYVLQKSEEEKVAVVERREVDIGDLTEQGFVINQGLQAGDVVVTAGVSKISPGMKVRFNPPAGN